jgi:hypothetical protein
VPASICRSREVRFGRQATCGAPQRPGRRTGIQRDVPGPVAEPDRRPEPRGGGAVPALRRALVGGAGTRLGFGDQRPATRAGPRRRRSLRVDRARGRAGAGAIRASGHLKPASAAGPGCATRAVWRLTGATPTRASVGTSLCTRCSRELQATRPARTSGRRSSVQGTVRDGPATASSSKLHSGSTAFDGAGPDRLRCSVGSYSSRSATPISAARRSNSRASSLVRPAGGGRVACERSPQSGDRKLAVPSPMAARHGPRRGAGRPSRAARPSSRSGRPRRPRRAAATAPAHQAADRRARRRRQQHPAPALPSSRPPAPRPAPPAAPPVAATPSSRSLLAAPRHSPP